MQFVTLNNGVKMPVLGFGVYQIPPSDTERAVSEALEVGYRHIDTAAVYKNEEAVGKAMRRSTSRRSPSASGIPRDDLFVTTKVWISDAGEDAARAAFERSAEKLGLDVVDLYLIHQPFGDVYGSWRALERLNEEGRVRAIGVSNFHNDRLADLIAFNRVVPAVNQVETHPFLQRFADQEFMAGEGVQIESWAPFAEGRNNLFTNPTLSSIARAHDKSVAQVVLRWLIQRGVVVIPKSVRRDRMEENFDVFDFELADSDMAVITTLEKGEPLFIDHRDPAAVDALKGITVE